MDTNKKGMLKCLRKSLGRVTEASNKANIARSTHYKWMNEDPEYKKEVEIINEEAIDYAEGKLMALIKGYSHKEDKIFQYEGSPVVVPTVKHYPPDTTAVIYFLKNMGRKRGWNEKDISELINTDEPVESVVQLSNGRTLRL